MSKSNVLKTTCSYCGESPINHTFYFFDSFITQALDSHAVKIIKYVPSFIKKLADAIPIFLLKTFALFKFVKFLSDIEKAKTFRSKVIWEEAQKRGIKMEQVIFFGKPLDFYRAKIKGKDFYFESLPIKPEFLEMNHNWDDKTIIKKELIKNSIPVPLQIRLSPFYFGNYEEIFAKFKTPVVVKPQIGSRARHTVTNIKTLEEFKKGVTLARKISAYIVAEEHLDGFICRATVVDGKLAGFYRGTIPSVVGDGKKTIRQLITERDALRIERYHVRITQELHDHIARAGFLIDDVLPKGTTISLSHRAGQVFGGNTKEMLDELHPSFFPILERAAKSTGLAIAGFDCIVPDPTKDAGGQRWGIIECNTLPFIDMHYYALEGKPKNIAGMIWDMWE